MLATALSVSMWPAASQAYTPEQEQACSGDALRLCGADVPDVDRITACMIRNKSQLSPGCRVFFRPEPEACGQSHGHRKAAQHQARNVAKAGRRQAAKVQEG